MYYEDSLDPGPAENSDRPAHVPAKFWDAANGQVRVDALLKAYGDLERRMGGMAQAALSPSPFRRRRRGPSRWRPPPPATRITASNAATRC